MNVGYSINGKFSGKMTTTRDEKDPTILVFTMEYNVDLL
jgi:hypothetical protein